TTVGSWHQYKSNTTGAELTTTVSVDAQGNALIKTDITSLPNDKYNIKVNLDNTVTQYADTKMDVVIDTSADPVIFGGHEYVCYADSSKSAKDDIYGNCGLIITTHISYTQGEPFGDVTPWSDPNATPSTYYEMYPNSTNTPGLGNDKKMNAKLVSTFDVTGLPAGEYEVYVEAKASSNDNANAVGFSEGVQLSTNGANGGDPVPGRYYVQSGTDEKVYTDTGDKKFSDVGLDGTSMKWTTEAVVKSVMIAEGTTSFKFGHTGAGYSLNVEAIRLVRIGSYMLTTNIAFDENGAAKVEAEAYSLKHTIFTNTGEETDYTTNYSANGVTYPTNLDGSVEDDAEASGGQYLHGLYRQGWDSSKNSNMSGEVVYRVKLTEEAKVKIKAKIKSNMETEKVCFDLKVDGARKTTFNSTNTWVEVESPEMTLSAGVHLISFVGQQLSGSENYTSVLGDLDWFELDKIPVPKATLKGNYNGAPADTVLKATDEGKVPELPTPTRAGDYKFLGWFTEAEGGTKVEAGADLAADMDLYAHWLEYTWTAGTKVNAVTPYETVYGDKAYAMMKADATGDNDPSKKLAKNTDLYSTYNITDAIPAGTYDLEFYGKTDSNTAYSFLTRYVVFLGEDVEANYIQPNAGNYSDYGWSNSGDKYTNKAVMSVTIPEGATSITVKYIGSGYSCFINGMRLVQRTANTTPIGE
ncbi:MAG: InlB B-repeat-containing protein, partial [Bacilli bacterium]|nr:InlB B-repeat-containing protein [Bacilli bacterium]